jgi:diguanylate cyclase (GGDEF)-like protein
MPAQRCPECGAEFVLPDGAPRFRIPRFRAASTQMGLLGGSGSADRCDDVTALTVDEQTRAALDRDQTLSDHDQTAGDADQTSSDRDQTASDRDEEASAEDQETSNRDLAAGGDQGEHDLSKHKRERTSAERLITSDSRDRTAADRAKVADRRDQLTEIRDRRYAAADRSVLAAIGGGDVLRAEAAAARAAADRSTAASDRARAADDRQKAVVFRAAAALDRAEAARERSLMGIDEVTGASSHAIGIGEIAREIYRARSTGMRLVLAFVDVNNLKTVNDNEGDAAGDALLRTIAETLRRELRPYDVIVRFGGDEFVCALMNIERETVQRQFESIITMLETTGSPKPISFGVSELDKDDDVERLIERARQDLVEARRTAGHESPPT